MNYIITKPSSPLRASITLPASKSISNRLLILNALSRNSRPVENLSDCDDTRVLQTALEGGNTFDVHAAGTAMRFLTAFCALTPGEWFLTGSERMKQRPIRILVEALRKLGGNISYAEKEGFPPLRIRGGALQGGELSLPGNVSSQYLSALLMVAPCMEQGMTLHIEGALISRPYIRMTLHLMAQYGVAVKWQGATLRVERQDYHPPEHISVEPDWSAASYWYEMVSLLPGSEVRLTGLRHDSKQGDARGAELFACFLGVSTTFDDQGVVLRHKPSRCGGLRYDFTNEPDLAQTFAVTCVASDIPFRFTGLQSLRIKETDRIDALRCELLKFGIPLLSSDGILSWNGTRSNHPTPYPVINTYKDHRMAMAFAPLALVRPGGLIITDIDVVEKSYPHFWDDLRAVGFRVRESIASPSI
ncbi:MAG: 3-phosphoshikimate 1-carboxyvinyltransferase [Tannerellaceae bacterium]|jgi:3-phosphoshikimate 1-carboxyvinyltransferase|nr:3-phosphoshikimate 1-carboxyvinyltransferase [Tannerellaceae bacterium]